MAACRRHCPLTAAALLLGALAARGWANEAASATGERVAAIEVWADAAAFDPGEVAAQIPFRVGEYMTAALAARALENLYALGVGTDLEIALRPAAGGGVVAMVLVRADYQVASVELRGALGLPGHQLRAAIEQRVGAPLVEDRVVRSVYALADRLQAAGYRAATVRLDVRLDPGRKTVAVAFDVAAGERATFGAVSFVGERGALPAAALLAAREWQAADWRPGAPAAAAAIAAHREQLRHRLVERGFLAARVGPPREEVDAKRHQLDLLFAIDPGRRTEVSITGVADAERLRRLFFERLRGTSADATLVDDAVARLVRDLQERGYYGAVISRVRAPLEPASEPAGESVELLRLHVVPGPKRVLRELRLRGNTTYPEHTLLALFETSAREALVPGSGRVVDAQLRGDLDNLRSYYQLQGFSEVQIAPPQIAVEPAPAGGEGALRVAIEITEGERQLVSNLVAAGMEHLELAALDQPALIAGGPFHPQRLEQLVRQLRARYEELGFDRAAIASELDWSEDRRLVDVALLVDEGPRTVIDRIIVRGNVLTRTPVVRRALGLRSGQPLSRAALLEAQRRLYQLGVFAAAEVGMAPRAIPRAAAAGPGEELLRDVLVRVEEGRRWRLQYGGSFDSEAGLGGLVAATYNNPAGRGGSLRLDLRANRRDQRFRLLYTDRTSSLLRSALNYALYSIEEELSSFESKRTGAQFEAVRTLGRLRSSLFLDLRDVRIDSGSGELPEVIERELVEVQIASATATLLYDRRDDPLDPRRGLFGTLQVEQAVAVLGTDERFTKVFVQAAGYVDLGRLGVLAVSGRGGAIRPGAGDGTVPVSERFFAGGRTTHRAFERDQLGIPGRTIREGTPVGGNGLLLLNLDLRFPIAGSFGGSVFYDAGNVWASYRDFDWDEVRHGVGAGVRYLTPIGPIRLELGYLLDADAGEDREVVLLSFGNPF